LGFWLIRGSALGPISGLSTASAQLSLRRLTALCPVEKRREEKRRERERPPNSPDLNPLDYHVWGGHFTNFTKSPVPLRS